MLITLVQRANACTRSVEETQIQNVLLSMHLVCVACADARGYSSPYYKVQRAGQHTEHVMVHEALCIISPSSLRSIDGRRAAVFANVGQRWTYKRMESCVDVHSS